MAGMNAQEVLNNVDAMLNVAEFFKERHGCAKKWKISEVCDRLSIFDWWNEMLSVSQLKQMREFLQTAIKLGFDGYVCFRVGAKYCSHGMWAHTEGSKDGYSPDKGSVLFHSFRSGDNYWDCKTDAGWMNELADEYKGRYEFTLKEVKEFLGA